MPVTSEVLSTTNVLGGATLKHLAHYIIEKDVRQILVLVGAGASVAAGIPDFRSANTGLYAQLGKYDLDEPSDAFSIALLRENPSIFYTIAREMSLWPGTYQPTAVHHFIKLLADEKRLLRCCTQNIDGLEQAAGLPSELVIEAHGSFRTASCIDCHEPYDIELNRADSEKGVISRCRNCGGVVKPDVVFFGESLPNRFFEVLMEDTEKAELVIIIGTSLQVQPFALLPLYVNQSVPRVLMNIERVGGRMFSFPTDVEQSESTDGDPRPTPEEAVSASTSSSEGFVGEYENLLRPSQICRDLFEKGDCQVSVTRLAQLLGLGEKLSALTGTPMSP